MRKARIWIHVKDRADDADRRVGLCKQHDDMLIRDKELRVCDRDDLDVGETVVELYP